MPSAATVTRVSAATVCQGTDVVFRASGTAGSTFTGWGTAGTASGTGNGTLTVSGTATGSKSVSAYARLTSSGTTCQSANAATVTAVVATMPAAATVTRVSAATVCQGTDVVFRASGTAGSTYTWLGTAGTASGAGNGTLTVSGTATGSKSVSAYARLTSSGTTCQSGNAATVTAVVSAPGAAGQAKDATCGCASGLADCSGTCTTSATTYKNVICTGVCNQGSRDVYNECGVKLRTEAYDDATCLAGCGTLQQSECAGSNSYCYPHNAGYACVLDGTVVGTTVHLADWAWMYGFSHYAYRAPNYYFCY
jgi:hypothetical protein